MDMFFFGGGLSLIFVIMFIVVTGLIIFTFVRGIGEWHNNNKSARLSVDATVISKRSNVTSHDNPVAGDFSGAHGYTHSTHTTYYATFEVESGDRIEFSVGGNEYGMLREGDKGKLTFQGTRYISFERDKLSDVSFNAM